ncbi:MAG: hypothetical protein FWG31_09120 [Oscillospiraceae bacterium]|nr:hypothetical protein [Oscillospiraceae bacterium]
MKKNKTALWFVVPLIAIPIVSFICHYFLTAKDFPEFVGYINYLNLYLNDNLIFSIIRNILLVSLTICIPISVVFLIIRRVDSLEWSLAQQNTQKLNPVNKNPCSRCGQLFGVNEAKCPYCGADR